MCELAGHRALNYGREGLGWLQPAKEGQWQGVAAPTFLGSSRGTELPPLAFLYLDSNL